MLLPFIDGYELIKFASDDEDDNKMFLRWVIGYQSTMSFVDFKNGIKQKLIDDHRSSEDILKDVEELMKRFLKRF